MKNHVTNINLGSKFVGGTSLEFPFSRDPATLMWALVSLSLPGLVAWGPPLPVPALQLSPEPRSA